MLAAYGHELSLEDYAQNYSGKVLFENLDYLIAQFDLPFVPADGAKMLFSMEKEYIKKGVALKPGARELLQYLKESRYRIVLATSSTRARAMEILMQNQVADFFEEMVFGTEVERGKPYPDIFLKACEKTGEKPQDCLILEDSEAGIRAAYAAGIPVICIPDMKKPGEKFEDIPERILVTLHEVIGYLKQNCCRTEEFSKSGE